MAPITGPFRTHLGSPCSVGWFGFEVALAFITVAAWRPVCLSVCTPFDFSFTDDQQSLLPKCGRGGRLSTLYAALRMGPVSFGLILFPYSARTLLRPLNYSGVLCPARSSAKTRGLLRPSPCVQRQYNGACSSSRSHNRRSVAVDVRLIT